MLQKLVEKSRSIRRFYGDKEITIEQLEQLIELARLSPSGGNKQALKYMLVNTKDKNEQVYETIGWAGYLKDWMGPVETERPTAYIIMLRDTTLTKGGSMDEGIAAQSMFLGAYEMGLGGCMIGNINRKKLVEELSIDDRFEVALIIALGYPKEEVIIDELKDEEIKYYRDDQERHHVPKRSLRDLIIK